MPNIQDDYAYAYIDGAATTQVIEGNGVLHSIVIGTAAAGSIKIIDNTSGSTVNLGEIAASAAEGTYEFNCKFTNGLRIITAAATKITVIYGF